MASISCRRVAPCGQRSHDQRGEFGAGADWDALQKLEVVGGAHRLDVIRQCAATGFGLGRVWAGRPSVAASLMDAVTIHALDDKPAKRKIMLWASGARRTPAKPINYTLCD